MLRNEIKKEIDQRGWSISRLASETGIRYPSLTEWFKGNKELSTINLQKILNILNMEVAKKTTTIEDILSNRMFFTDNPILKNAEIWDYIYDNFTEEVIKNPFGNTYIIAIPYQEKNERFYVKSVEQNRIALRFTPVA